MFSFFRDTVFIICPELCLYLDDLKVSLRGSCF